MRLPILLLAALVVLSAAPAQAAARFKPGPSFAEVDLNHDGFVTLDEFQASLAAKPKMLKSADRLFKKMDANHDGRVDKQEFGRRGKRSHPHA
ncbi:MAG: EF-hand domain pair [Cyanobacteria bacterium RYN_339]|nr:EF-hand domain pair [Cyanobacteria bacterium RYN_339]